MKRLILLIILIQIFFFSFGQESYFTNTNILKFANHLKSNGEYARAANEYQRFIFASNDSLAFDTVYFNIAWCYQKANNFGMAKKYYDYSYKANPFIENSLIQKSILLTQQHKFTESNFYIDTCFKNIKIDSVKNNLNLIRCYNLINLYEWKKAEECIPTLHSSSNNARCIEQLNNIILQSKNLPHKSPALAGIFSAIIPGSGKMYVGREQDAIYSFLLTGLCGWQAYDGFSKKGIHSVRGWISLGLGTVFYTGNIYGSIVSAGIYNQNVNDKLVQQVDINFLF